MNLVFHISEDGSELDKMFLGAECTDCLSEDGDKPSQTDFQRESESQQSELVVPDSIAKSFTPSEDYVFINDVEQEKPVEKPVEQGRLNVNSIERALQI